jgi:hypothetical protein
MVTDIQKNKQKVEINKTTMLLIKHLIKAKKTQFILN